ncbi:hypothetical protein RO865_18060 [Blautia faecis]|jgi:hypothetical protein|uniref:hypothetical protein n=1 Tax=Blautia faecis TaxID=871665 RepID=UPI00205C11F0|nr:hypothetical protein [Blautia faecis]MDT4370680.1 hypothetical protein [Blautia faecis]DAR32185.1 MAG TPA: hypothetical protein [Caudoviricetes sp.]
MTVKTVKELIDVLKNYPQNMRVASACLPFDDLEVNLRHYESDNYKVEEFDFIAID